MIILLPLILLGSLTIFIFWGLPDAQEIKNFKVQSTVQSFENIDWEQRRSNPIRRWVPLGAISENLQKAVIISEDDTFLEHKGVNFEMMREAFKVNLERKRYARGASTITMQLARNAFLNKEKSLLRKIREIIVARRMEDALTKKQILELYLNIVEWGNNIYGAEAAAQYYFGKPARALNLAESSLLAGMLPNPKRFNPYTRMQTVKKFQKRVLHLLKLSHAIDAETAALAYEKPIYLRGQQRPMLAPAPADSDYAEGRQVFEVKGFSEARQQKLDTVAIPVITPEDSSDQVAVDLDTLNVK